MEKEKCETCETQKGLSKKTLRKLILFFAVGRTLLREPFQRAVRYDASLYDPGDETFLIVSNHTNLLDPAFLYSSVKSHYRVVMSDQTVEHPVAKFLLEYFSAPIISYQKNHPDEVYEEMLSNLRNGINVSLYVEARVTDTGETGYISKRNATLVKEAGCGLITYRFRNGYLSQPRWSRERRSGPVYGEVVHHFTAAQIAHMSEEEIYQAICEDLYFNAYEEQRARPMIYKARHPAEHAEYVLYGCPKCGRIGGLHTKRADITCEHCGFTARVDAHGFWHGEDLPFDNIPAWDAYQKEQVYALIDGVEDPDAMLFQDADQKVYSVNEKNRNHLLDAHGTLALSKRGLTVSFAGEHHLVRPEDVRKIKYVSKGTLVLVTPDYDLRIRTDTPRAASKYVVAVRYLRGKKSI